MIRNVINILIVVVAVLILTGLVSYLSNSRKLPPESFQIAAVALSQEEEWHYRFQYDGILEEAGNPGDSSSPYWWLNSGARMIISTGIGRTVEQDSDLSNFWRNLYKSNNPIDTDDGAHPQNIFRLLTKTKWLNTDEEMHFKIDKLNMSESGNRNGSNGVLLMSRYLDSNNLYYAGVRVDSTAVIKKKRNGIYTTLAQKRIFETEADYIREINPNMIPGLRWMGIRSDTYTDSAGLVHIDLYVDKTGSGDWQFALGAIDNNQGGSDPIKDPGLLGIRTDFMNVEFDDFVVRKIGG